MDATAGVWHCAAVEQVRPPHELSPATVAVVIPAYQAAAHLDDLLPRVLRHAAPSAVFVIDDGSTDATAERAQRHGVRVLRQPLNQGKGAALRIGFAAARGAGFTHALTLDADGQHPPECIPRFLAVAGQAEIVIGWRLHDPAAMPRARRLSNHATAAILSALARQTILDGQSGYRLYALAALAGLPLASRGFMLESELLVRAAHAGARIGSVPIPCVYGSETSHIHAARDTLRFLWLVGRSFFW